jgi:hypothetical protein
MATARPRHRARPQGEAADLKTIVVAVALAVPILWLTVAVTLAMIFARPQPHLALALWPFSAEARAQLAARQLSPKMTRASAASADALATAALAREPVNVAATRTLSATRSILGRPAQGERLLAYADVLSRRDLLTQMALIEGAVARDDIPQALIHYDRALRVSARSEDLLFPILIKASADPDILRPLAEMVGSRPPWWQAFMDRFLPGAPSAEAVRLIVSQTRLKPSNEGELGMLRAALARLVELNAPNEAAAIYRYAARRPKTAVNDGRFEAQPLLPPLDWAFVDEPDLRAHTEPHPRGGRALFLSAANGRAGDAARQYLALAPGRYRLSVTAGDVVADLSGRPRIMLLCRTATGEQKIFEQQLPQAPSEGRRIVSEFVVPTSNCAAQWLAIRASAGEMQTETWMDDLSIQRVRPV